MTALCVPSLLMPNSRNSKFAVRVSNVATGSHCDVQLMFNVRRLSSSQISQSSRSKSFIGCVYSSVLTMNVACSTDMPRRPLRPKASPGDAKCVTESSGGQRKGSYGGDKFIFLFKEKMCLGGAVVRALDLRLKIAGSIPAAALSSATLDKLFTHIVQRL